MVRKVVKTIPAGEFKKNCLRLLDEIDRDGIEIVVTKHGVPVAKLVPVRSRHELRRPSLAHMVVFTGDVESPIDVEWDAMKE